MHTPWTYSVPGIAVLQYKYFYAPFASIHSETGMLVEMYWTITVLNASTPDSR